MPSGRRPPHHWKTTTFVGALRRTGMVALMVLDGPINRDAFEADVEQILVPDLRPGDVVNRSSRQVSRSTPPCQPPSGCDRGLAR